MKKYIKMCLYGEPGVGKSTFAQKFPKPYFITTDGNYAWLEGAKEEDHIQVNSWADAKKVFKQDFKNYETIVIDLTEDLFKWCEHEFCVKNRIDHVSDIGYGKAYDITRNEFFLEMCKLIGLDKNVVFIMHGEVKIEKDRRGVEHTKYVPSSRLPDKLIDRLEGRVRYFLRCYLKAEEVEGGKLVKNRYLSLVPKENEFGICRGIDESKVPHDIPLEWSEFAKAIGFDENEKYEETKKVIENPSIESEIKIISEEKNSIEKESVKTESEAEKVIEAEMPLDTDTITREEPKKEEVIEEPKKEEAKPISNEDKLAAIRAKLAALKNNNK